jgi:hypothetical protein
MELNIVKLYDSNIKAIYSINQISKKLNKAYPYVNKKVSSMIDEKILNKVVIGKSYLCSLNLKNEKTTVMLTLNEINKKKKLEQDLKSLIKECIIDMKKKINVSSVIYVGDPEEKLIFVLNSAKDEPYAKKAAESLPLKKMFITNGLLKKMIIDENTGVFKNKILLYGYEKYFETLFEIEDKIQKIYSPIYS